MTAPSPIRHQVLIVDDDADIREAVALVLDLEGFDVAPACGVEDAYRRMHDGFHPCVVLLDLHMPGLDGWAFLDRRKAEPWLAAVAVAIVSGDADQRAAATDAGCDFLLKPVQPHQLVATVARRCRRQHTL
jgi:two-component system OmpR family response regulator